MKCWGLDIGSSSIKGAVLDVARGEVSPPLHEPFPAPLAGLPAGRFEIDPNSVVSAVGRVLARLADAAPDAAAVFCSGQMGGVVLVDSSGAPLTNYLSWRDQRTQQPHGVDTSYLAAIRARWTEGELAAVGNELQAGSAMSLLFWLAENNALPTHGTPVSIADFVLGRLCQVAPPMDATQALGWLDLHSGERHQAAAAKLGLDRLAWPRIVDPREPIGFYTHAGRRLACHASFGDQPCALRGIDLSRQELSLNISTGSQVSRLSATFTPGTYQTRPYFGGEFLNTITHLPAGRSLNVLVDLLTESARAEGLTVRDPWDYIARRAEAADGGGLTLNLAFFAGPLGDHGRLDGITTENLTVGNLFHAAFRAMADNYVLCADRLCADRSGMRLALSGGLTRSIPLLRKLIQERFALPVRESAATEEVLLGLLSIARDVYSSSRERAVSDAK